MSAPNPIDDSQASLKLAVCRACGARNFIPAELPPLATTPCVRCGQPVMMPMKLRQLELRAMIGSGGMGTVYRAFDSKLNRDVAVKMMKDELATQPEAMASFSREARACASLNHTNIVHIYTFDEGEGHHYLVMELADCGSLDDLIIRRQRLTELEVLDIGIKVASALATALKHNLLHRDIKPGNILFNNEGEPKLVDFGLATAVGADGNYENFIFGTPYYVAPERLLSQKEDFHSDLYSLGATLYHALTGHVPFDAPSPQEVVAGHIHTAPTPPNQVVTDITQPTSDVLLRTLAKNPAERFASYDEFTMALTAARSQLLVNQYVSQGQATHGESSSASDASTESAAEGESPAKPKKRWGIF